MADSACIDTNSSIPSNGSPEPVSAADELDLDELEALAVAAASKAPRLVGFPPRDVLALIAEVRRLREERDALSLTAVSVGRALHRWQHGEAMLDSIPTASTTPTRRSRSSSPRPKPMPPSDQTDQTEINTPFQPGDVVMWQGQSDRRWVVVAVDGTRLHVRSGDDSHVFSASECRRAFTQAGQS